MKQIEKYGTIISMKKHKKSRHSLRVKMMAMNLTITLSSLILCGLVFIVSVWLIVGKSIDHDIDFFLTQTNDNLNSQMEYLENVIYQIRDSSAIMDYLQNDAKEASADNMDSEMQEIFQRVINISSEKNLSNSGPAVEKIYLFDNNDNYFSTFYYAMIYSEITQSDETFWKIYQDFCGLKQTDTTVDHHYYSVSEQYGYLAYTLLDDNMVTRGTVIYEMNLEALRNAMKDVDNYEDAFWITHDSTGAVVEGQNEEIMLDSFDALRTTYRYQPYTDKIGTGKYRIYSKNMCMDFTSIIGVPENQTFLMMYDSVKVYILVIGIIMIAALFAFIIVIYKLTKPIQEITDKMQLVKKGKFETKLPDYNNEEFHAISQVFNEMTEYINHLVNQVYEKQLSIKEMELKFLQTQMNPHFMFNVLNTIALQAKMDHNEEVYKMISSFSQLIQAKIYRIDTEKVTIRQEIEYVQYYLYLQSYRFGDKLEYAINIEKEELLELYIPKLCIQLIVENAVVHGIEPKMENGFVKLNIYVKEESVYIDIADNGVGFEESGFINLPVVDERNDKEHNHVGMNNANHIIKLMYGEKYGITIYSEKEKGTTVSIHIPFDKGE